MTMPHSKDSFDVDSYRSLFDQFIGALIDSVIGGSRMSKLFEGDLEPDQQDKSSGMVVLDLGIVTENTKVALLIAQAAERTARLAEKAMKLLGNDEKIDPENWDDLGYISHDDSVFRYVGSEQDHQYLRITQASWQAAQIYFNQLLRNKSLDQEDQVFLHDDIVFGFLKAASMGYRRAAFIMQQEGQSDIADNMDSVSIALMKKFEGADTQELEQIIRNMVAYQMLYASDASESNVDEQVFYHKSVVQILNRLLSVVSNAGSEQISDND